ncbi:MAG: STAS domain-containing protein [Pseudonocardia sp.]
MIFDPSMECTVSSFSGPVDQYRPTLLDIDIVGDNGRCVVQLRGELDLSSADQLREALHRLCCDGHRLVVVDLAALQFLAVVGLAVLVEAHQNLHAAGSRLVLIHPASIILRVLTITGLDAVLAVEDR